jgi:plastocyanin
VGTAMTAAPAALALAPLPTPVIAEPAPPSEAPPPPPPPVVPHVQVTAVEYSLTLSRTTVPAGKVDFEFVNAGQDEHNAHLGSSEDPEGALFENTPSKGVDDLQVEVKPGTYTLFCSLPHHEERGMKATLLVE